MIDNKDYQTFLNLLERLEVEYLIIGGYAVNLYGYIRATGDIDLWLNPTKKNAEKMLKVMLLFGYSKDEFSKEDFIRKESVMMFGDFKSEFNLLCYVSGIDDFQTAYTRRNRFKINEGEYNFIHLSDLIINKQATGRDKDVLDVKELLKIQALLKKSKE